MTLKARGIEGCGLRRLWVGKVQTDTLLTWMMGDVALMVL